MPDPVDYVHLTEQGTPDYGPGPLPLSFANVSNLAALSDPELAERRWYPVAYVAGAAPHFDATAGRWVAPPRPVAVPKEPTAAQKAWDAQRAADLALLAVAGALPPVGDLPKLLGAAARVLAGPPRP